MHTEIHDVFNFLLKDMKRDVSGSMHKLMKEELLKEEHVGMIFYTNPEQTEGFVVSHGEFRALPHERIGVWCVIDSFEMPD